VPEEASQGAEAEQQTEPVKEGKKKVSIVKILILLIIVLVLLGGMAGGAYWFLFIHKAGQAGTEGEAQQSAEPPKKEGPRPSTEAGTFELKPFIVNLADEGAYLKVTIALGYGLEDHKDLLEKHKTQVRDTILTILSSKSVKMISTKHGKMRLKEDIKKALDEEPELRDVVTSVYFTDFVIQ